MKVVLLQNVKGLGMQGEAVLVKDGYALNYLIPRGFAANPRSTKATHVQANSRRLAQERVTHQQKIVELVTRLEGTQITLQAKAGINNRLYGSITKADIAQALGVSREVVMLRAPIRHAGSTEITLQFGAGHVAKVTVVVEPIH